MTIMTIERALTRGQARAVDRIAIDELGMSSLVLMENAGRGVAESLVRRGARVVAIACGRGNNGGDGFVVARHLALRGIAVRVCWFAPEERLSSDAQVNFRLLRYCAVPCWSAEECDDATLQSAWLADADWGVDCLLGTGAAGPLRPAFSRLLKILREHPSRKLAVDLPTGLDADRGEGDEGMCAANVTCTLVAPKQGMVREPGKSACGEIEIVGIGTPDYVLQRALQQEHA